ncbi:hypothetical protein KP509_21G081000 [Ceratopteris richardii]|uniref:Spindle and kinetochore-associated protein 3 n=1 Tax=Ceratopteris richardii TaxID=49495 RepID=A0A8T2SF84_CERRI|nr:hypothetical protein KP509_21G081000 [Ceratopteris richardii]
MEDCSDGIAAFCNQLRSYCLQLESSCAALRASVNQPPSSIPSPNVASLLTTLISHVSSASQAVAKFEAKTTETVSFEELIGHSMEIYKQNEASMDALEVHLRECGYTVPEFSPDDDLEELASGTLCAPLSARGRTCSFWCVCREVYELVHRHRKNPLRDNCGF